MKRRQARRNRLKKGWGSVYKIQTKRNGRIVHRERPWTFRYQGKFIGYYETEEEAIAAAYEFNKDPVKDKTMTFKELWELWCEQKSGTISSHTVKNYESKYRTYCQPLYKKEYKDLRPKDFLEVINAHDVSNGTKNNTIKFLRAMDRFAYELDLIDKKYTDNIQMYKAEASLKRPFTESEIKTLWENQNEEDVDLVLILLYSGLRSGELEDLKIENINLEEEFMIGGIKSEAGKNRYIPIHSKIKEMLKKRIKLAKGEKLLNYTAKTFRIRFKKVMKKFNMNHTSHECRHTFVTRLDNAGANNVCVRMIVGHAQNGVTGQVYTHKSHKQLKETIELLT